MFVIAGFVYAGLPLIYRNYSIRTLKAKVVNSNTLVFTFDDGSSDGLTSAVLDLLDKHDTKATFSLLGRYIQDKRKLSRKYLRGDMKYVPMVLIFCSIERYLRFGL